MRRFSQIACLIGAVMVSALCGNFAAAEIPENIEKEIAATQNGCKRHSTASTHYDCACLGAEMRKRYLEDPSLSMFSLSNGVYKSKVCRDDEKALDRMLHQCVRVPQGQPIPAEKQTPFCTCMNDQMAEELAAFEGNFSSKTMIGMKRRSRLSCL